MNRRELLKLAGWTLGGAAASVVPFAPSVKRVAPLSLRRRATGVSRARNVVMVHLAGGMSHADCWDFKETRHTPHDLEPRRLSSDLQLSQTLFPRLVQSDVVSRISFVRSMRTEAHIHPLACYQLQTGRSLDPRVALTTPAIGSVIGAELAHTRRESDTAPSYVVVNAGAGSVGWGVVGQGFLPHACQPNVVDADNLALAVALLKADAGTRMVYVRYGGNAWDMHERIYDRGHSQNIYDACRRWDVAFTSVLEELDASPGREVGASLLDETLVVCASEFGRSPVLNASFGRDHHPDVFTVLLAGGGIRGGTVLGKTNADGSACIDVGWPHRQQPRIENVAATIYAALGIDWRKRMTGTLEGSDFEYVPSLPYGHSERIPIEPLTDLFI